MLTARINILLDGIQQRGGHYALSKHFRSQRPRDEARVDREGPASEDGASAASRLLAFGRGDAVGADDTRRRLPPPPLADAGTAGAGRRRCFCEPLACGAGDDAVDVASES